MTRFAGNSERDDIAMLSNLISQGLDSGIWNATAYDRSSNADYGVEDVLSYIRDKYGEEF